MANPEHLAKLMEGREGWNAWRKERPDSQPDLTLAKLESADLSGFNLFKVDMSGADLRNVNFSDAELGAAIADTADLSGAFIGQSDIQAAWFENTVLVGSFLFNTSFRACNFRGASFERALFERVTFLACQLTNVDFSGATITQTVFGDVDLRSARFLDIEFRGATIGIDTFFKSGGLPDHVLRAANVPEEFITYAASLTGKAIEYYSCFISYSSKDDEFTRRLHADLQQRKIKTWFAPEDLKIGDRFHSRIDESIRIHDKLVLILSQHSIDSAWVRREVEAALEREDREKKDVLFPIRLDDTIFESNESWANDIKRSRHIGDFRNWKSHDDYTKALERLVKDLKKEGPIVMR